MEKYLQRLIIAFEFTSVGFHKISFSPFGITSVGFHEINFLPSEVQV